MELFEIILLSVFLIGYTFIAIEHNVKLDKTASALLTGVLCWTVFIVSKSDKEIINEELLHHLAEISSILFFLMGAMTIVELIGGFGAFDYIKYSLNIKSKASLLIILSVMTFFLSAILDNLTTAIVMSTIILNLLEDKKDRLYFAGVIVIVANAGGAWSPMGDVTTTMLWIGEQISAFDVVKNLIVPSLMVAFVPVLIAVLTFKGEKLEITRAVGKVDMNYIKQGKQMLYVGIGVLILVPIFKTLTHLPPFMGMMLSLGLMWVITAILQYRQSKKGKEVLGITVQKAMQKADMPSILFFLGILLAVSALQSSGLLTQTAIYLDDVFNGNIYAIGTSLGILSSGVDNVPLVAAAQKMYSITQYPLDHPFWHFLALTAGTGGSMIIIGSAAGVAIMGKIQIEFMWYIKKISLLALLGFIAGIVSFYILHQI